MRKEKKEIKEDKDAIEIKADVRVGDFILEKGDKIVILEADDKKDDKKDDDDDDDKKDKDKKDKDEKKEAITKKLADGEKLTVDEKKFVIRNF